MKASYVYILASKRNGTLYVGVTSDLPRRIYEHKQKLIDGLQRSILLKLEELLLQSASFCLE